MQPHPLNPPRFPAYGTPASEPIRLSSLKLPTGMAKHQAPSQTKNPLVRGPRASIETIHTDSGTAPEEVAEMVLSATPIRPESAGAFERTAAYKNSARPAPRVSLEGDGYLRLEDVLTVYPVSRSAWYEGIKRHIYPAPVPLGRRSVGWSRAAIRALVENPPKF